MAGHRTPDLALLILTVALGACAPGGGVSPGVSPGASASTNVSPSPQPSATGKPTAPPLGSAPAFAEVGLVTVGQDPGNFAVGDLDGDGSLDLVSGSAATDVVSIALGHGDGTFDPTISMVAPATDFVGLADISGDGTLDLIIPSGTGVSLLIGTGDGGFGTPTHYEIAADFDEGDTYWLATGDLDGDGAIDVAVSSYLGHLAVLMNHGDGTFDDPVTYEDPAAVAVAMGDFDGDGHIDLATANFDSTLRVLPGVGDGTFGASAEFLIGARGVSIVSGDANEDGVPDLLTGNDADFSISILLGKPDGSFGAPELFHAGNTHSVALVDLDGDGHLDLLGGGYSTPDVVFVRGFGDGTFEATTNVDTGGAHAAGVAAGDFNGDGRTDLAVAEGTAIHIFLATA
jgi:hypothetical protein